MTNVTERPGPEGNKSLKEAAPIQAQGRHLPAALEPLSPFAEHVGVRLIASEAGRATAVLPVRETVMTTPAGIDSGAIAVLVEAAGAAAVASHEPAGETPGETVELSVSFLCSPPQHPLTAEARVVRRERDVCLCDVQVRDWNGDVVARGSLTRRG